MTAIRAWQIWQGGSAIDATELSAVSQRFFYRKTVLPSGAIRAAVTCAR
jgi:hypothetical protein